MSNTPSDDELQLTPEEEPERPLAPEEPFRTGMILVPVHCSACRLRYYAQEKHIGLWSSCPDCGRLNEILPPDPGERVITKRSSAGTIQTQKLDDIRPNPRPRVNVDYRTVEGSVDKGAEILPMYGLNETSEDELENIVDRFIEKDPNRRLSPGEIRYQELTRQRQARKQEEQHRRQSETAQEHRQRVTEELNRARFLQSGTPDSSSAGQIKRFPSVVGSSSVSQRRPIQTRQEESPLPSSPWESFFAPLTDRWQRRRFSILFLAGFIALAIFFVLDRYIRIAFNPESSVNYSVGIFCFLWFLADIPVALWGVMLTLSGITLFEATKDGENIIRRWILFRTDLAMRYVGWIILLLLIIPMPGEFIAVFLRLCHIPSLIPPGSGWESALVSILRGVSLGGIPLFRIPPDQVNMTAHIVLFGMISAFLLFPIVFLSISSQETGLNLLDKRVLKSIVQKPLLWFMCYLALFLLVALIVGLLSGAAAISQKLTAVSFPIKWSSMFFLGGVITVVISAIALTLFRLLGCLAWSVFDDSANQDVSSP